MLAGNPNCGKTTLFNCLTGSRQRTGNYPGITVEKREGHFSQDGAEVEILDLPGTYGLMPFSPEERIAEQEIVQGDPDVVVLVVDSTTLRRSLIMLAQVMQTGARLVLVLNMADEAEKSGQRIDVRLLSSLIGCPVVETVGHLGRGIAELREAIGEAARRGQPPRRLVLGERMDAALHQLAQRLIAAGLGGKRAPWMAARLLTGNRDPGDEPGLTGESLSSLREEAARLRARLESETGTDIGMAVMQCYYGFVDGLLREVTLHPAQIDIRVLSDAIDAVLVHRIFGVPFFLLMMYLLFWFTFRVGELPMQWLSDGFALLGGLVTAHWPDALPETLQSLLVDGAIAGVGGVIVFLPNIAMLFLGLGILEDTGYMARVAFLTDRVMHLFGLHGKSFVPMITGFGCSVPAIMATRTLENERDRLTTMLVVPLIPCGARFTIWMLLVPAFFPEAWRAPVLMAIYLFGVSMALAAAWLLRKTALAGDDAPFVMELPPYRAPTWRGLLVRMADRCWAYLRKAGTVILGVSILLWALSAFRFDPSGPFPLSRVEAGAGGAEASLAGRIGRLLEPATAPLGFDWRINVALLGATAAKEVVVSQMSIVFAMEGGPASPDESGLRESLRRTYPIPTAVSLILFLLVALPCVATVASTRRESGGWKWALWQLGGLTALGYVLAWLGRIAAGLIAG